MIQYSKEQERIFLVQFLFTRKILRLFLIRSSKIQEKYPYSNNLMFINKRVHHFLLLEKYFSQKNSILCNWGKTFILPKYTIYYFINSRYNTFRTIHLKVFFNLIIVLFPHHKFVFMYDKTII